MDSVGEGGMAAEVGMMEGVFPDAPKNVLLEVLKAHDGNVERALDAMLWYQEMGRSPADVLTFETIEDQDEQLARRLQQMEASSARAFASESFLEDSTRDRGGNNAFSLQDIRPEQLDDMIKTIKEIVVPALQDQVSGLVFPPIENSTDKFRYSLQEVKVVEFQIPLSSVDVKFAENQINIKVEKVQIELDVGNWSFEKLTRPRIHDNGSAKAVLKDVDADLILTEGPNVRSPLEVQDCNVKVGRVTLRTAKTRASWLYNTLAVLFRPALKTAAEQVLKTSIADAVREQAGDWGRWVHGD